MNFHVKDDFQAGEPISSVSASWFNKVAGFLNNLVGATGIKVNKPEKPSPGSPVTIEPDTSVTLGTPVAVGSTAGDEVTQQAETLWRAGGANGARLLVFFKSDTISGVGMHDLYAANVTISADGRIIQIDAAADKGIEIGA